MLRRFHAALGNPATAALLALALYAVAADACFGPPGDHFASQIPGEGQDPLTFIWYLAWWPWAILHGQNPLVSDMVWAPTGYNLTWGTSLPTAALLAAPITLTAGPGVALGVLMVAAPCLSAFAAYLVAWQLGGRFAAALVTGLLYGFSSFETGQMLGHLNLALNFPVPLILLLAVRRVTGRTSARRFILLLTLALLTEFGISTEMFASLVVLGGAVWLVFLLAGPRTWRPALCGVARDAVLSGLLCLLVLLPFLLTMAAGASAFSGFINSPETYSSDLLNLIVPTEVTRLGRSLFAGFASRFTGNASEQGAYLGIPLLVILTLFAREHRHTAWCRALLLSIAVLFVASLGPVLHVGGWTTTLPLPWALVTHLPMIEAALPARFSLYVALATAVAAGIWIASASTRRFYVARAAAGGLACLFLVPNRAAVAWSNAPALPFFAPTQVVAALGANRTILILPYGVTGPGMYWQVQAAFGFRQAGGYLSFVPSAFERLAIVLAFFRGQADTNFASDLSAFCATHDVSAIIAGPGTPANLLAALTDLGWKTQQTGGVMLVQVPPLADLHYVSLIGDSRPSGDGTWQLAGPQVTIATHGRAAAVDLSNTLLPGRAPMTMRVARGQQHDVLNLPPEGHATLIIPRDTQVSLVAETAPLSGVAPDNQSVPSFRLRYHAVDEEPDPNAQTTLTRRSSEPR